MCEICSDSIIYFNIVYLCTKIILMCKVDITCSRQHWSFINCHFQFCVLLVLKHIKFVARRRTQHSSYYFWSMFAYIWFLWVNLTITTRHVEGKICISAWHPCRHLCYYICLPLNCAFLCVVQFLCLYLQSLI